jgi:3-deoxy-D-manno-octulosonate 8-phosphate phosphatase (KDO 8-P phosphatase)
VSRAGGSDAARRPPGARALLAARFPQRLRARAAAIRVLGLDSDGTLTDRGLTWDSEGREARRFDVRDGLAVVWAMRAGLPVIVISGRTSPALVHRTDDLGVPVVQGTLDKVGALESFCAQHRATAAEVAFLGDDLPDLPALRWCGLPVAVADAHPLVKAAAAWVTPSPGGCGAVRELIEALLDATGRWDQVLRRYGERERPQ